MPSPGLRSRLLPGWTGLARGRWKPAGTWAVLAVILSLSLAVALVLASRLH